MLMTVMYDIFGLQHIPLQPSSSLAKPMKLLIAVILSGTTLPPALQKTQQLSFSLRNLLPSSLFSSLGGPL
jgi:uncharacterized membrane protein YdcZ (DUF606 family)